MFTRKVSRPTFTILLMLITASMPISAFSQHISRPISQPLPACPVMLSPNVDARRSLMVTEVDVVSNAISLGAVMDKLIADSGVANLTKRRLWAQWWDTQNPAPSLGLGPNCNDQVNASGAPILNDFPLDCPRNEGSETAHNPFDTSQPGFYYPIALVNRLDLAAEDGAHCGEYRVIFARDPQGGEGRNLLIFEAVLPNPNPSCGIDGCRDIAKFWARLSGIADPAIRAQMLHDFYFEGLPAAGVEPVIHAKHFGRGAGQIRTNQFMSGPSPSQWQLREFKLALVPTPDNAARPENLLFVPVTTKDTPWGGLFNEGSSHPQTIPFMRHFVTQLDELDKDRVTQISFSAPNRFNSGQSTASFFSESDYPAHFSPNGPFDQAIQARLNLLNSNLTPDDVVRRARTQNCAGCHQLSNNDNIGNGLVWPASLNFVHVHEQLTESINGTEHFRISPALKDEFLPHRERVFEACLGADCQSCQLPLTNRGSDATGTPAMSPIALPEDRQVTLGSWIEWLDAELKRGWPADTLGGPAPTH